MILQIAIQLLAFEINFFKGVKKLSGIPVPSLTSKHDSHSHDYPLREREGKGNPFDKGTRFRRLIKTNEKYDKRMVIINHKYFSHYI